MASDALLLWEQISLRYRQIEPEEKERLKAAKTGVFLGRKLFLVFLKKPLTFVEISVKINIVARGERTKHADLAHLVERHLAKVEVASSSLVIRSIWCRSQVVRQRSAKPLCTSSNLVGTSRRKSHSLFGCGIFCVSSVFSFFAFHRKKPERQTC